MFISREEKEELTTADSISVQGCHLDIKPYSVVTDPPKRMSVEGLGLRVLFQDRLSFSGSRKKNIKTL
jgi:hypothetical protein